MATDPQQAHDQRRRDRFAEASLHGEGRTNQEAAAILTALSEIDDLPIQPEDDPVMGQLVSKLTSTANLSADEVRSNEWVREYILILYLCQFPTKDGCHGSWRGWAHGDADAAKAPMDPSTRMELETLVTTSKLALSRSEDAKVIEEGTRDVKETHVNDGSDGAGGGGILGKIGLG
jgi:hypothetical protein